MFESSARFPCEKPHLLFADIITMKTFPISVIERWRNVFRVLDAYGTEQMFNNDQLADKYSVNSIYGGLNLHLKQFYTFYRKDVSAYLP